MSILIIAYSLELYLMSEVGVEYRIVIPNNLF